MEAESVPEHWKSPLTCSPQVDVSCAKGKVGLERPVQAVAAAAPLPCTDASKCHA